MAAPLAPFVAPLVAAGLPSPSATTARAAVAVAVALLLALLVGALRRSRREALVMLASTTGASMVAAHLIAARDNLFFTADLLYEACAVLLAGAAVSGALRVTWPRQRGADGARWLQAHREVADTMTRVSAWLLLAFWSCVAGGLRYLSAGVLFILAGTIGLTVLFRVAELAVAPVERKRARSVRAARVRDSRGGLWIRWTRRRSRATAPPESDQSAEAKNAGQSGDRATGNT